MVGPAPTSFPHQDLLPSKTPGNLAPAGLGRLPMGDRTEDARGGAGANKSSCPSPSSVPVFPSHAPRTLPYTFSYVPHIMPALTLIPGPHSRSRTPAESGAQGPRAPPDEQPLRPVPAGLSTGPPLAWMGCCLLTKQPTQQGPLGWGVRTEGMCMSHPCPAPQTAT